MSYWYPQACVKLRILNEDFKLASDPSLQKTYPLIVVPRNVSINVNDHKTSDTFSMDIDYKTFPFDPRIIRYCGVTVYVQDMQSLVNPNGSLNTIRPIDSSAVFAGFVDEESISFDDTKRNVHFEGRDFSGLLIDQKYLEQVPIDLHGPLDLAIGNFLAQFPATKEIVLTDINLKPIPAGSLPILGTFYKSGVDPHGGQMNTSGHETYWDIINSMVTQAGLICYMHLNALVITTPRNLFGTQADAKFIYGKNVKTFTMKRKLGRLKNFNLLVRSRVGSTVNEARIPLEAFTDWATSYGIPQAAVTVPVMRPDGTLDNSTGNIAPYISFPVQQGIADKGALIRIGQSAYETYSRQQIEGTIETRDMLTHSAAVPQIDLTQLDIGQPIALEIDTDDLTAISRFPNVSTRIDYLIQRNYARDVAVAFATSMGKFSQSFYTKSYTLQMGQDTGFSLKINFVNIIKLSNKGL